MWTYTLMSEFMPARKRGLLMGMWALFLPLGLMMTAQISAWVIPNWGWRMLSLIGAAPAVAALFVRRFIPESPRFLIQRGRIDEARQSLLLWVSGGHALPAQVEAALVGLRKVPQKQDKKLSVVRIVEARLSRADIFRVGVLVLQYLLLPRSHAVVANFSDQVQRHPRD